MRLSTIALTTLATSTGASQLEQTDSVLPGSKLSELTRSVMAPMSLRTNLDQIPVVATFGTGHYVVGKTIFHLESVDSKDYARTESYDENAEPLDQDVRKWLISDPNIRWTAVLMRKLLLKGVVGPPLWVFQSSGGECYVAGTCCCQGV